MSKLVFDAAGERFFETGVSKCVLFPHSGNASTGYEKGVAWNGITNITDKPSGAEATPLWADNIKYLNLFSAEQFAASIQAYTYPDEWAECDGSGKPKGELSNAVSLGQQDRKMFGLCYRTEVGNDQNDRMGYILHFIYNCKASPSEKAFNTVNDSPEAIQFSWEVSTTPVEVEGFKPTAYITVDSRKATKEQMTALENYVYGTDQADPTFPTPAKILEFFPSSGSGIDITVSPELGTTELLGKLVSELQEGVSISQLSSSTTYGISGTLHYVEDYTGFSSNPEEQQGNYLALKIEDEEGATTTVEIVGGTSGPVALDSDKQWVGLIRSNEQSIRVISTKGSDSITKEFSLTSLTLEAAG